MAKPDLAVVVYDHESVYTVMAIKLFESSSFTACEKFLAKRGEAIVRNFEGNEINAMYVQQLYPESVE